jgi:hypothetical protein
VMLTLYRDMNQGKGQIIDLSFVDSIFAVLGSRPVTMRRLEFFRNELGTGYPFLLRETCIKPGIINMSVFPAVHKALQKGFLSFQKRKQLEEAAWRFISCVVLALVDQLSCFK